ncbi:annexin D4-like [Coffea eugenioides]|uniref:Annexin D4-like n=1 Tax=Coffea arabica TaxID=13443 RepID=A0A6P6WFB9_COFAR|nr:annexin D4-like [Coffea eugenioides]
MAVADEFGVLTKAFTGLGVDEKSLISILGKWHPEHKQSFRKTTRDIFVEDERQFERWDDRHVQKLQQEFLRFKDAVVLWTMHPWERDARLLREAVYKGPKYGILVEIACTRSSEELLGARRAYHSLFEHSIEEDIAFHIHSSEKKLLVGLVSAYRYEGPKYGEEVAKSEAKILKNVIKDGAKKLHEEEEIVRILTTRSKLHLKAVFKHYKETSGNYLDEDLGDHLILKQTVQCLCKPETYFTEVLDVSLKGIGHDFAKEALTRVIVTRADVDLKLIKEEYHHLSGFTLSHKIEEIANGNFKDFLLTLIARGDQEN